MSIPSAGRATTFVAAMSLLIAAASSGIAQDVPADHPAMDEADQAMMDAAMVTMSHDEIVGLLQGQGMGMAKAAEKNAFPGPKHVLELADELSLTDEQKNQVTAVFTSAQVDFRTLGKAVVETEAALNRAFMAQGVSTAQIASLTRAAAEARGQLRARHLAAHVATRPLMSDDQVQKYVELRSAAGGMQHGQGEGMQHGEGQGMQHGEGQGMQHGQGEGMKMQCKMHEGGEGEGAHQCKMHGKQADGDHADGDHADDENR